MAAALSLVLAALRAFACGPFFPNTLLDQGDRAVLTAPEARFKSELERMKLVTTRLRAQPATNYAQQTFDAELTDLRAALAKGEVPADERDTLVERHRLEREKIVIFAQTANAGADNSGFQAWVQEGFVLRPDSTNSVRIPGPMPQAIAGLPGEFADYFRGSVSWHLGNMADARGAWEALLARPAKGRPFKSTWAAFMLGKSWEEEDADRAISYFRQVRSLAKAGFTDTLGLAAASLGWEARLQLRKKNFAPAIDLYLEHAASGDPSAVVSLRWTASRVLHAPDSTLRALASQPRAQRVVTAYVISGGWREPLMDVDSAVRETMIRALERAPAKAVFLPKPKPSWHQLKEPALRWLEAVEAARVRDVESAEQLALAAYQGGQMERTQRWLQLARPTPVAQWLRAKLLLRDGKVDAAAGLIAGLVRRFPLDSAATNRLASAGLAGSLFVATGTFETLPVVERWHGEWGVFQMSRRQYAEALDALMRSGYWLDAAYVAERVLTVDELKAYVDRHWQEDEPPPVEGGLPSGAAPSGSPRGTSAPQLPDRSNPNPPSTPSDRTEVGDPVESASVAAADRERIRHLLARRLVRAERRDEARRYFPPDWRPRFYELAAALRAAGNAELPPEERAAALFRAAQITRWRGLELVGAEVEPDWQVHGGNYQFGVTLDNRLSLPATNSLTATAEEIQRATQHSVTPEVRWHYRFQAAAMAWEAAKLMPDNSDDTARVLCIAGTWIKYLNPPAADVFYKSLVRRCRKTAIGAEADRIRWFPLLDDDGNLRPRPEQPLSPEERKSRAEREARQPEADDAARPPARPAGPPGGI